MTEKQIEEILREIYGYLKGKSYISDTEWTNVIEPRIKAAAKRIAALSN